MVLFKLCIVRSKQSHFSPSLSSSIAASKAEINCDSFVSTMLYEKTLGSGEREHHLLGGSGPSGCPNTCEFPWHTKAASLQMLVFPLYTMEALLGSTALNWKNAWFPEVRKAKGTAKGIRTRAISVEIFQRKTLECTCKMKEGILCVTRRCGSSWLW